MANLETVINAKGAFVRQPTSFRNWVRADKSTPFQPEPDRYHLYVCHACPWAHRTLAVRALKGLEHVIGVSSVHWLLDDGGWHFEDEKFPDHLHKESKRLKELYLRADPEYNGRVTVPVLWDKKLNTIVNNESAEIIRMLSTEFNEFAKNPTLDLFPVEHREKIEEVNTHVYTSVNDGVYKCGFARQQEPYDAAFDALFAALDKYEALLSKQRWLLGNIFTEADIRLFTSLLRFDPVYYVHFKCNKKRLVDYPNLFAFTREIYQMPGIKETVHMDQIKAHYYVSHKSINPFSIIPKGPEINFDEPHQRNL